MKAAISVMLMLAEAYGKHQIVSGMADVDEDNNIMSDYAFWGSTKGAAADK